MHRKRQGIGGGSRAFLCRSQWVKDLSLKVHTTIQPVFVSRKIDQGLTVKETKPPIVNQQCVVYGFQCDLCDAGYVRYKRGHLHNRVKGHTQQSSAIAKHYKNMHGTMPQGLLKCFEVFKKFRNKFECLVRIAIYKSFKAKSQRAIRLHLCESIFIIFTPSYINSSCQNRFKCSNLRDLIYIFLDNGVMTTPNVGYYRSFLQFCV